LRIRLDLLGLLAEILSHGALFDELALTGYLQFGKGLDVNYDPVCFDFLHRLGVCRNNIWLYLESIIYRNSDVCKLLILR
jgi:hypothetical protein